MHVSACFAHDCHEIRSACVTEKNIGNVRTTLSSKMHRALNETDRLLAVERWQVCSCSCVMWSTSRNKVVWKATIGYEEKCSEPYNALRGIPVLLTKRSANNITLTKAMRRYEKNKGGVTHVWPKSSSNRYLRVYYRHAYTPFMHFKHHTICKRARPICEYTLAFSIGTVSRWRSCTEEMFLKSRIVTAL